MCRCFLPGAFLGKAVIPSPLGHQGGFAGKAASVRSPNRGGTIHGGCPWAGDGLGDVGLYGVSTESWSVVVFFCMFKGLF